MEKELTIKQLIKRTYLTIIWQFLLCLILFYIVPALLSSVTGINEKNANRFALFNFTRDKAGEDVYADFNWFRFTNK